MNFYNQETNMAKLQIDLSGRAGLAPRFWGDIDRTVATPELRILGKEGQMADGIYNPFRRYGYMSPANATFTDVIQSNILTTTLGSSVAWETVGVAITPTGASVPAVTGIISSGSEDTSDTTYTLSHTTNSSTTFLVIAVQNMTGTGVPTGVTWDGAAMTKAVETSSNGFLSIWYYLSPGNKTADIVATWGVNTAEKSIHAININGGNAINVTGTGTGSSTTASLTLSPTVSNTLLFMATGSLNATHAPGEGQTERTDLVTGGPGVFRYSTSTKADATTILGSSIYDSANNDFYFAERGQRIFKGDTLDDTTLNPEHDLGATGTPVIMDLEIYQLNGTRKLFYVYESGGNLNVGEATLPIAFENDNWLTTDVSGAFTNGLTNDAFMRVADNGFAYLFADNDIHKIDGTTNGGANGTISANVLQFPEYFQIVDAIDYRGNMYVAIHQNTEAVHSAIYTQRTNSIPCGIYIWDRRTTVVNTQDYIPLEGVKQIRKIYVSPQGDLRLIVVNSENIVEIRKYNGSTFAAIEEAGYIAYPQFHDSLTNIGGLSVWLGVNGNIYAHGKISPFDIEGIYKIGNTPDTVYTASTPTGAIMFGGGNTDSSTAGFKSYKTGLYIPYINSSAVALLKAWDIYGTGADGITNAQQEQGNVYTLVKFFPTMSTVHYIDIYNFPQTGSGSTTCGTVKIYFNQSSTAWASKTITRDQAARGYVTIDVDKQFVNSIQLEFEFETSIGIPTFDYAPSFAVVDYTVTETRG